MTNLAVDDRGNAMAFDGKEWKPAPVAQNDRGERMAFDGKEWLPLPKGEKPGALGGALKTADSALDFVNRNVINPIGTGLTKGVTAFAGAPRAAADILEAGATWAGEKLGAPEAGRKIGAGAKFVIPGATGPRAEEMNRAIFGSLAVPEENFADKSALTLTNPFGVEGKVNVGKMLDTGIQAIPGSLALGGGALPAFMGGMTSEMAGQAAEGSPWEPVVRVAGAIPGGWLGSKLTTPLPANLTPEQARLVALAKEKGIPLTVGQETGRGRGVESALARFPTSQGRMADFADDQATALNRDALKQVGATGERLDPTTMNRVIKNASDEFDAVKNASGPVKLDTDFYRSLEKTIGGYLENTPAAAKTPSVVKRATDFVEGSRVLSGEQYQEFRRTLNDAAQSISDVGARRALQGMRNALDDAMEASLPTAQAAAWREVRKNWANLKILTRAAAGGTVDSRTAGNLSPSALSTALRSRQGVDRFSSTTGGLNDTARVAAYLADTIPNSGTPQTLMTQGMVTGGPIGAGFLAGGMPGAAAGAGVAALPNVAARAMTGAQGFGWLRDYLANQARPNTMQEMARVPFALAPGILTDQRFRR